MSSKQQMKWQERAASLHLDGRMWVAGERTIARQEETFDCISPIDGKVLCKVARGQAADVDLAVTAARSAFDKRRWAGQPPSARKKVMQRWAELLLEHREELALLETLDMGKPINNSLIFDVPAAATCLAWYGEAIDKMYDEIAPTAKSSLAMIRREPVGVVGAIVPWNYPMVLSAWKLGPAIAAGNSVVLKPSERSPLTALRMAELAALAGIPAGVINVVPGYGAEAGEALAMHPGVDAIAFTGSTSTGRKIIECAGKSNLKRVHNELGGKSANIVFADCSELDRAAKIAAYCIFFNQGESCNAPSRLLLEEDIADLFIEKLLKEVPKYAPGHPLGDTAMGALVDERHLDMVLEYIERGMSAGATCLTGGRRVFKDMGGCYLEPTIFDHVDNSMALAQKEIFGPVLSIIRFKGEEQAIQVANHSSYGLHAGVWSDDLNKALRVAGKLQAGTIHVNSYNEDDITVPFGGYKQSGNGRDKSLHAFDNYTELKTIWVGLK